jgi:5-oxoprolinase (ATP-hydrolysing)/N-methylhydantoinase A
VGNLPALELPAQRHSTDTDGSHAIKSARPVYFDGNFQKTAVYDGHKLQSGNRLQGPAIIELRESTTVVLPGQQAVKGGQGEVVISAAVS